MSTVMEPAGAVQHAHCRKKLPDVCLNPREPGPVLIFFDRDGAQHNVCRACADALYASREWIRPGEEEHVAPEVSEFSQFLRKMQTAPDPEARLKIAREYRGRTWRIRYPIVAGEYRKGWWIADIQFSSLGSFRIAVPEGQDRAPAVIKVRPVRDSEEYDKTQGAVLIFVAHVQ